MTVNMATTIKDTVCAYALKSLGDMASFAGFVSYAENLTQIDELFESQQAKECYEKIWFELEIINALALSQWETEGCPLNWKSQWESGYKQDASDVLAELLTFLT